MGLRDDLRKKYSKSDFAEAYFYKDSTGMKKVVFLQLATVGWECSDDDDMGSVLKGTFYFADDLNQQLKTGDSGQYIVQDEVQEGTQTMGHVIFYKPNEDAILGEFLSDDPKHVIRSSGLIKKENRVAQWQKKNYITFTASVKKSASSTEFTMTIPSSHLTATFNCDKQLDKELYESAVQDVQGNLFSDTSEVTKAITVKWSSNSLVFYPAQEPDAKAPPKVAFFSGKYTLLRSKFMRTWIQPTTNKIILETTATEKI